MKSTWWKSLHWKVSHSIMLLFKRNKKSIAWTHCFLNYRWVVFCCKSKDVLGCKINYHFISLVLDHPLNLIQWNINIKDMNKWENFSTFESIIYLHCSQFLPSEFLFFAFFKLIKVFFSSSPCWKMYFLGWNHQKE